MLWGYKETVWTSVTSCLTVESRIGEIVDHRDWVDYNISRLEVIQLWYWKITFEVILDCPCV